MRIFISSPLKGLQEIREEILKKEKELDVSFSSMESFLSSPNLPIAECLQHLKDSDAVILIIGPDYGSVDAKTGKSFTHLEYDEAQKLGIKVFGFVKALSLDAWAPEDVDPDIQQKHRRFFEQVKTSGWINSFTSTDDLISKINAAIAQDKERLMKSYRPFVEYCRPAH